MRKTKIICTLGPASKSSETLRQLMHEGADVFRLNMSHSAHPWVREIVPRIREIAAEISRPVAIFLDTRGQDSDGTRCDSIDRNSGDILEFTVQCAKAVKRKHSVAINTTDLHQRHFDVSLVDNGVSHASSGSEKKQLDCCVLTPGRRPRRHDQSPASALICLRSMKKDLEDVIM